MLPTMVLPIDNPYATPKSSDPSAASRYGPLLKQFVTHFGWSAGYGLLFYIAVEIIDPISDSDAILVALAGLLVGAFIVARFAADGLSLLVDMFGLTWGFVWCLSIAISIQNGRVSVAWPRFLFVLFLLPIAYWAITWPVYRWTKTLLR